MPFRFRFLLIARLLLKRMATDKLGGLNTKHGAVAAVAQFVTLTIAAGQVVIYQQMRAMELRQLKEA